jgi:hypothetical protein
MPGFYAWTFMFYGGDPNHWSQMCSQANPLVSHLNKGGSTPR